MACDQLQPVTTAFFEDIWNVISQPLTRVKITLKTSTESAVSLFSGMLVLFSQFGYNEINIHTYIDTLGLLTIKKNFKVNFVKRLINS